MFSTMTPDTYKQHMFPAAPFPRKHIHSVFNDRQDALQAAQALRALGYNDRDIHILSNSDYLEAVERGQTLIGSLTSTDLDAFLDEARQGCTILAVRLSHHGQMEQVRDLLISHHARLMKYIDTWTMVHLLP